MSDPIPDKRMVEGYPATENAPVLENPKSGWLRQKFRGKVVGHRRWVRPLAWILLGALLNTLVLGFLVWWLVGSSPGRFSLTLDNKQLTGTDLSVRVSQIYLNREISQAMKTTPLNVFNLVAITDLKVTFNPNSQVGVIVRLNTFGRDFDFGFKDSLAVINQKVVLAQSEDVKLQGLNLPLSALNEVVKQVNQLVELEINRQVGAGQTGNCVTCTNLGRVPTLKSLTTESGMLIAQFDIEIKK